MTFKLPNLITSADKWLSEDAESTYGLISDMFNHYRRSFPRLDIYAKDSEYLVDADLPGVDQKDVEITLDDNILTIKGKKETSSERKEKDYYTHERFVGTFQRSITLPSDIKEQDIDASFENGVLHIRIPKNGAKNVKKIEIKS